MGRPNEEKDYEYIDRFTSYQPQRFTNDFRSCIQIGSIRRTDDPTTLTDINLSLGIIPVLANLMRAILLKS
jgi:hypothetical protein